MSELAHFSIDQVFEHGLAHHRAGRLAEAEGCYRHILARHPAHADSLHLLGAIACHINRQDVAIDLISRAIALNPKHPAYHSNLGEAFRKSDQTDRAVAEYRIALSLDPNFIDAYLNYGVCLLRAGRYPEARDVFLTATRVFPSHSLFHRHLGDAILGMQHHESSIESYRRAIALNPALTESRFNMGVALSMLGRHAEAITTFNELLTLTPDDLEARSWLAESYASSERLVESLQTYQSIIDRDPKNARAYESQASMWRAGFRVDEAIAGYRKALELAPGEARICANLAFALRDYAELDEANALLKQAVDAAPESAPIRSGYIFTLYLSPHMPRAEIAREEQKWNEIHVRPLIATIPPHTNDPSPDRRLKIGYVSADLRSHPVGRFMKPLLKNHDRAQVEVFCYSAACGFDAVAAQLRELSDHWLRVHWLRVHSFTDEKLAEQIRADQIDILIDLNMHTIDNRLLTFARKPAPIQMTYLAYCAGTGLETIDYHLTDRFIDPPPPPGTPEPAFEKPLRLETHWCYAAHPEAGEVAPLPALAAGHITFGSFNYFSKINRLVLDLWSRLLLKLPDARLLLHVPEGSRRPSVQQFFADRQINPARVTLMPRVSEGDYFRQYALVDIALDPFPFAGGTTTCDALYMGVPVVTLAGENSISRGGASILSTLGLPDLVAQTPEEYLQIAARLASDIPALAHLRTTLRGRMQNSPLMDAPRFARNIEQAYRQAWITWCNSRQ